MQSIADIVLTPEVPLAELYRRHIGDYPKFFKMDLLSRVGFVASELLLQQEQAERFVPRDDRAVILAGRLGSINNDRAYEDTIRPDNYFPSPSLFVYTLPNIVTGEIAIRNKYLGETMYYALANETQLEPLIAATLSDKITSVLGGWIEAIDSEHFIAKLHIWTH